MATINTPISTTGRADLVQDFQKFLDRLAVPSPRQLVLIQPQLVPEDLFDRDTARMRGYYNYPPVGLLYLAAVAKEINPEIDVRVLDLNHELCRLSHSDNFSYKMWQELLFDSIRDCDAPHVGVTYMFGTTKPAFMEVSRFIRENFPQVPLLSGGVQASYDYQEMLESDLCDIVFRNEGELQFKAFLESSMAGEAKTVPWGSVFKLDNQIVDLGPPAKDVPMDWDIRPYYSLIDIENYHKYGSLGAFSRYNGADKGFATVLSNRGCRARCTFCTVRDFNGFGIRQRSVGNVIEEIKHLVRDRGIQQIDWLDDDLLWDQERTLELFKGLAREVPELEWTCSNGLIAVAITEDIMYWMVESGLKAFKIGIESGNDQMLHLIKKPTTKPKLREKRDLFKKYPEVFVSANFILGFPNETFGQMMDTFNFASELEWDWSSFYICQPLKGTEMFSAFQELGDDRCEEESYIKSLNPGRSAPRGEFGYRFDSAETEPYRGWDVFNLPPDQIPSKEQLQEIWFTFNLVANFLKNINFAPGGNPTKLVKWLEAVHSGYPYDASMAAALKKGYMLLGEQQTADLYEDKFEGIVAESSYWQHRVEQFPELLQLVANV